jgi:hypothetical protein
LPRKARSRDEGDPVIRFHPSIDEARRRRLRAFKAEVLALILFAILAAMAIAHIGGR